MPQQRKSQNTRLVSDLQRGLRIHVKEATRNSRVSWKNGSQLASHWNARNILNFVSSPGLLKLSAEP